MFHKITTDNKPPLKRMVILVAKNVDIGANSNYTTDPWIGWLNKSGEWARWPHELEPTHYAEIDYNGL